MAFEWPEEWDERRVDLLEVLQFIADEVLAGRPLWLFTGSRCPEGLVGFMQGWTFASRRLADYSEFNVFVDSAREEGRDLMNDLLGHEVREQVSTEERDAVERFLEAVLEYSGTSYGSTQE